MFRFSVLEPTRSHRRIRGLIFAVTPTHFSWIAKMDFILSNCPEHLRACLLVLQLSDDSRGDPMASLTVVSSRIAGARQVLGTKTASAILATQTFLESIPEMEKLQTHHLHCVQLLTLSTSCVSRLLMLQYEYRNQ